MKYTRSDPRPLVPGKSNKPWPDEILGVRMPEAPPPYRPATILEQRSNSGW